MAFTTSRALFLLPSKGAVRPENAMVAMVCISERANIIDSAGSYLRDLTKTTACGEFFLGPLIMAALEATA